MKSDSQIGKPVGDSAKSIGSKGQGGILIAAALLLCQSGQLWSQSSAESGGTQESAVSKVERLTAAVADAQAQMAAYQLQLQQLRQQLTSLQEQLAVEKLQSAVSAQSLPTSQDADKASLPSQLEEIRERQAIEESQIATHDVSKVETESKYPLKLSGLLLFNGFVNTRQVDTSASPSYALPGAGSTGLSVRQTVLGFDARGPHLLGANSHADLRVDFFANGTQSNYAATGVLRLRTAHASLNWPGTEAFVELDRAVLEPNQPSSLVSIAQPELAWAGNLWNWNPQIGLSHDLDLSDSSRIQIQAALIDTYDPQPPGTTSTSPVTQTERSRWPGSEARIAFHRGDQDVGAAIGIGGYFSPHRTNDGSSFDAWAATMDLRLPLTRFFEIIAAAHRGQSLAGLGAGGYINYYEIYPSTVAHALDDVGGWAQAKVRAGQRVQMNTGFGTDNPFAKEIHDALSSNDGASAMSLYSYPGLARNRSLYSNVIYSPTAYLLFSIEYKALWTNFATGPGDFSNSIGIGAGYRF